MQMLARTVWVHAAIMRNVWGLDVVVCAGDEDMQ